MTTERINVGDHEVMYADPQVHAVALAWQERHNFDLQRLDNWISTQCAEGMRELMLGRRRLAIACEVDGNVDAVYFALAYFQTQIGWHSEHTVAMPEARLGVRSRASHRVAAQADRSLTADQKTSIRRIYADRVRRDEKYGAVKALAAQFGVSRTTISSIVNSTEDEEK